MFPPTPDPGRQEPRFLAEQVFVVSAAMVGVSLTLMGLVGIIEALRDVAIFIDDVLAADAAVFLAGCVAAYLALRTPSRERAARYGRAADVLFIGGLICLVVIGGFVAVVLI